MFLVLGMIFSAALVTLGAILSIMIGEERFAAMLNWTAGRIGEMPFAARVGKFDRNLANYKSKHFGPSAIPASRSQASNLPWIELEHEFAQPD